MQHTMATICGAACKPLELTISPRLSLTSRRNLRPSAREGIPTVESTMGTRRGIMIA